MSIQTEVNRIKTAKADIVQAIRDKGVTVPTTAKVGDLATYISSIKTGADIKTCNVTINIVDNVELLGVTATQFADGAVNTFSQNKSSGQFEIPNVVCDSIITIVCNGYFSVEAWSNAKQVGLTSRSLTAPPTTGDYTANIIAYDD